MRTCVTLEGGGVRCHVTPMVHSPYKYIVTTDVNMYENLTRGGFKMLKKCDVFCVRHIYGQRGEKNCKLK